MKRLSILLFGCVLAYGQRLRLRLNRKLDLQVVRLSKRCQIRILGLGLGRTAILLGNVEILSDTQGVDFGPYLKRILATIHRIGSV